VQRILINFGKKIKLLHLSHIQRGKRNKCREQGAEGKEVIFIFYSLPCPLHPDPCSLTSSPLPAPVGKYAYLYCDVNINEIFMQLHGCAIILQTINLRLLVSKNTKSCDGKLACSYY